MANNPDVVFVQVGGQLPAGRKTVGAIAGWKLYRDLQRQHVDAQIAQRHLADDRFAITLIECQNTTKSFITMTGTHADTQRYRGDVIFYIDSGIRVVNRVPMETYLVGRDSRRNGAPASR